jgi:hypothetical protein
MARNPSPSVPAPARRQRRSNGSGRRGSARFIITADVADIGCKGILSTDRMRFTQCEIFKGLLVSFGTERCNIDDRCGFQEMNQALKLLAEHPRSSD